MSTSHNLQADALRSITQHIFVAAGTPETIAANVADILVNANLTGHDSHGVIRIPAYLRQIEAGDLNPAAEPEIIQESDTTLTIDGHHGFGHHMARQGMAWAIKKAKKANVCAVSFRNATHIGRLGEYAEAAARAGCIGFVTYGLGGAARGRVVPFGGAKGALSTNPLAFGIPTGDAPFVLDFATSVVAEGKLQVARSKNTDVPTGYIVDKTGNPTTKTTDFYDGGYLLPFGAHKGYALSLMICLLGGLGGSFDPATGFARGEFMQVVNVEAFVPLATYEQGARAFLDSIRATPPAPGFEAVITPGDFEHRLRTERLAQGIELPETVYRQIQEAATKLSVAFEA